MFSVRPEGTLTLGSSAESIVIRNPADSGRIMYADMLFGGSRLLDAVTANRIPINIAFFRDPGDGTDVLVKRNLNYGFIPEVSLMVGTFVDGGLVTGEEVAQTIENIGAFMYNLEGRIVVPPGHSLGIQFSAPTISLQQSSIVYNATFTWYELDISV